MYQKYIDYVNQCRENYPDKSVIIDLTEYPYTKFVICNGKKHIGYFRKDNQFIKVGCNNKISKYDLLFATTVYGLDECTNIHVLTDNPEVKRVYTEFLKRLIKHCNLILRFDIRYNNYMFQKFFRINPVVYTNVIDFISTIKLHSSKFDDIFGIQTIHIPETRNSYSIKELYDMSPKYVKTYFKTGGLTLDMIKAFRDNNFSPEEIEKYRTCFLFLDRTFYYDKKIVEYTNNYLKYVSSSHRDTFTKSDMKGYYRDYLRMRSALSRELRIDFPKFPAFNQVKRLHDKIMEIYYREQDRETILKNKDKQVKYAKEIYPKAIEFNYSNKEYSIFACKDLIDLVQEGRALHHCVGSYIDSVSAGKEYILFLRKNFKLDKSYFTLDLTPDKKLRQAHGFGNCNLPKELMSFVKEWANKFKINITDCSGVKFALR